MKGGREHRVPLSDRAVAVIEDMQAVKHGAFIFPGAGAASRFPTWRC